MVAHGQHSPDQIGPIVPICPSRSFRFPPLHVVLGKWHTEEEMTVDPGVELQNELRRLIPRQFTDWRGRYMLEDDPSHRWRECRVIDVSSAGAGLVLSDTTRDEAEGRHILLAVQLRAVVRNLSESKTGIRAGTQFVDLSPAEHEYLRSLARIDARW